MNKIMSIYWFAILFIVAAGVVYMVYSFYGAPFDARGFEVDILTNKIASCVSRGGVFVSDVFSGGLLVEDSNLLEKCKITFEVEDTFGWNNDQFYVELVVSGYPQKSNSQTAKAGNINLKDFCGMTGKYIPACSERSFFVLDENKNPYEVNIIAVVAKTEKNVK